MALSPQIVQAIAHNGVQGDTLLGHLTRGDTVIPRQAPPAVHDIARQSMAAHGMDVNRFVAGSSGNHINPHTGLHEFADGGSGNGGNGGEGGGADSGGGGGSGGGNGSEGGGGANGHGGDSSAGAEGSGGGAQGGNPNGGADTGGDTGSGGGGGNNQGTQGGNTVSGGANGMGVGGGNASGGANSGSGQGVSGANGSPSGAPGEDAAPTGKSISQALLGIDFSNLGPAGKLAMGVVPGATTLAGLNEASKHGVDDPSNPGGNVSASATGGVGTGVGAASSAGGADRGGVGGSGPAAGGGGGGIGGGGAGGSSAPDTVQRVLNRQTIGSTNGGTAAPDKTTLSQIDPFTDLNTALNAAQGLDRVPTFTSGSDADIINTLLGQQHGQADQQLQNAHARGTLSDTGFNSAELGLGNQDQQARARLGSVSDNLLASYQQKLDAIANQAIQSASGTTAANPFDLTPWQTNYNNTATDLQGRLQGDLLNLLPSGGSLYDIPSLLAQGGNSQGLYNPGGSTIMQALADQRGVGTTGSF